MKLIVGLGNPGRQYVGTRHNVGFEALDRLARRLGWISADGEFERLAKMNFDGLTLAGLVDHETAGPERVLLLKPLTFMNLSGKSVQPTLSFYRLLPNSLMVIVDDLALPAGRIRIRPTGSSGGHHGLEDIERALGTSQYARLRIGIDPPPPRIPGRDYVLGRFSDEQRRAVEPALDRTVDALLMWIRKGIDAAMSQFNAAGDTKEDD